MQSWLWTWNGGRATSPTAVSSVLASMVTLITLLELSMVAAIEMSHFPVVALNVGVMHTVSPVLTVQLKLVLPHPHCAVAARARARRERTQVEAQAKRFMLDSSLCGAGSPVSGRQAIVVRAPPQPDGSPDHRLADQLATANQCDQRGPWAVMAHCHG